MSCLVKKKKKYSMSLFWPEQADDGGTGTEEAPSEKVISLRRVPEFRAVESLSWGTMCAEAKLPSVVGEVVRASVKMLLSLTGSHHNAVVPQG